MEKYQLVFGVINWLEKNVPRVQSDIYKPAMLCTSTSTKKQPNVCVVLG